jgi:hypothetical protein
MPNINPNSTNYVHSFEPNTNDLVHAMDYTEDGKPAIRVLSNIQGDITIEGDVTIPGIVTVTNTDNDPLFTHTHIYDENDVEYSASNPLTVDGTVTANVTFPASQTVDGTVNIGTMPEVEIKNDEGNPIPISGTVSIDNFANFPNSVTYADSTNLSAFSRLRTANTRLLGEFRNMYGTTGPAEITTRFEEGGSQTVNLAQTHTMINVTTSAGSRALRQSRRYHPYIPGTTNLAFVSFTFDAAQANLQQMVGLFDDSNGIFLRLNGDTAEMVIRKAGVDNEVIPQSQWNVDKLDGTGSSNIAVDWTKSQVFFCDYQWLGVGRVRVGLNINGQLYLCHSFNHANEITEPYMFQPSLPVRWEIKNTGTTAQASSMMAICYGVYCEGSDSETGFENGVSTNTTRITLGANADSIKGLIAVRLRNTVNGQPVRAFARVKDWQIVTTLTARYRVMM